MANHNNEANFEPVIDEAALILWPKITFDQLALAWRQAADEFEREARRMEDQVAEMLLRSGGKLDTPIRDLVDGGPLDPEPGLRAMFPDDPTGGDPS